MQAEFQQQRAVFRAMPMLYIIRPIREKVEWSMPVSVYRDDMRQLCCKGDTTPEMI